MKRVLLVLSIMFISLSANSQTRAVLADEAGCLGVSTPSVNGGNVVPGPKCAFMVHSASDFDSLSATVNGLDAQLKTTIDGRFTALNQQLNKAVADRNISKPQIEEMKKALHQQIATELSEQLKQIKAQLEALKAEVDAVKGK